MQILGQVRGIIAIFMNLENFSESLVILCAESHIPLEKNIKALSVFDVKKGGGLPKQN